MFKNIGLVTAVSCLIAVIAAVIGGIICIVNPDTLSFFDYLKALVGFVGGLGLLGIGRGIHLGAVEAQAASTRRTRAHV